MNYSEPVMCLTRNNANQKKNEDHSEVKE